MNAKDLINVEKNESSVLPAKSRTSEADSNPIVIALGIIVSHILFSTLSCSALFGWGYVDALYFTVVTFTTVGYGDITPKTDLERAFGIIYMLFSISIVGFAMGIFFSELTATEDERIEKLRRAIVDDDSWKDDSKGRRRLVATNPNSRVLYDALAILVTILVFGTSIAKWEGLSWVDGIYFSIVSATTIGYGDVHPTSNSGKLATSIFLLLGCSMLGWATTHVARIPFSYRRERKQMQVLRRYGRVLDHDELKDFTKGCRNPQYCTKAEFTLRMLQALKMVDPGNVEMCERRFDSLDLTSDGRLSTKELSLSFPKQDEKIRRKDEIYMKGHYSKKKKN